MTFWVKSNIFCQKVKLNPVHSVIKGSGNCSPETHYPTKGYDKQSFVVPVVQNDEKVTVIGGKQAISCTLLIFKGIQKAMKRHLYLLKAIFFRI